MYERGLSSGHLTGYEAQRWIETHGDLRMSFDRIEEIAPPDPNALMELVPELARGEALMVAAMGPRSDDNQFYVEHLPDGTYGAFSMRPRSTEEPAPMRCEEAHDQARRSPHRSAPRTWRVPAHSALLGA